MTHSFSNRLAAVRYVDDLLFNLRHGSQLTMTITRDSFAGFSASHVIDLSSEDIDLQTAKFFSDTQVNI